MTLRTATLTLTLALAGASLGAQRPVEIVDIGPGPGGRVLKEVLRRPHRLAEPDSVPLVITREVEVRGSLVVLGRSARIDGTVDGDVVVVGGELFVSVGASIHGRAVAIGGGAYPSALAVIDGEVLTFRYGTYDIRPSDGGYRLSYRSLAERPEPPLLFPVIYGIRSFAYDRVNGASVPFGPAFSFADGDAVVNVLVTGRTDMGVLDPSMDARFQLSRRNRLTLAAGRGSFSNDAWIWRDLVHSFFVLSFGEDNRNFFRADRMDAALHRLYEGTYVTWEPFLGARWENAWSAGPAAGATSGPWSLFERTTTIGMRRPNPAITPGHATSLLAGTTMRWERDLLRVEGVTRLEASMASPGDASYQQLTTDVAVGFPTFGEQSYEVDVHWVTTLGDAPPPQRYGYLGGSGTLPFVPMLAQGGDQVLLIDQRYSVPLTRLTWGAFGSPVLQLRHRIGSAGLGSLPSFEQMLGVGISVTVIRGEVQFDPVSGRARLTAGFTFSR